MNPGGSAVEGRRCWRRTAVVRAVLLSAGLYALVWLPPVLDVVWNAPSNARQTYHWFDTADEGGHTLGDGWRVISAQFGTTPEWLAGKEPSTIVSGEPQVLYGGAPLPVLLVLVAGAAVLLWRRRVDGTRALVVTLGLALVLGILGVAQTVGPAYDYRLRWTWMPPVLAFVLVAWTAWRSLVRWRPAAETRLLVPASLATLLVLGVVSSTAAARAGTPYPDDTEVMATITPPVLEALDEDHGGIGGDGQVVVDRYANQLGNHTYGRGLVLQLERHGIDARVPATPIRFLPESRNQTGGPVRARLVVAVEDQIDEARAERNYRLLSIWSPLTGRERDEIFDRIGEVQADHEAGGMSDLAWITETKELVADLRDGENVVAYAVAVFLDERVGDVSIGAAAGAGVGAAAAAAAAAAPGGS